MCCVLSQWSGAVGDEGVRRSVSAVRRGPWQHEIVEGLQPKAAVTANFTNQINLNGWSFLEIHTEDGTIPDEELAYMAGMLEANLTAPLIQMHWKNIMGSYCTTASDYCTKLESFISQNSDFVAGQIRSSAGSNYWHQVNLFNMQLAGLKDGYSKQGLDELPQNAFLLLQIQGDLEDLESALGGGTTSRVVGSGSCSALVKLLPGNSELLVSHDTWSDYHGMLRIFKHYDLKFRMTNGSSKRGLNSYVSCRRGKPRFSEFSSFFLPVLIVLLTILECINTLYTSAVLKHLSYWMHDIDDAKYGHTHIFPSDKEK